MGCGCGRLAGCWLPARRGVVEALLVRLLGEGGCFSNSNQPLWRFPGSRCAPVHMITPLNTYSKVNHLARHHSCSSIHRLCCGRAMCSRVGATRHGCSLESRRPPAAALVVLPFSIPCHFPAVSILRMPVSSLSRDLCIRIIIGM